MKADGTSPRQVSSGASPYQELGGLDWSPDGQWIIGSTYAALTLVHVTDGVQVPLRVIGFQAAFKP